MNRPRKRAFLFGPRFKVPPRYTTMIDGMCREAGAFRRDSSFLLFRLFKLSMAWLQFLLPYNWFGILAESIVDRKFSRRGPTSLRAYKANYMACEAYILGKFLLPLFLVTCLQVKSVAWQVLLAILVSETVIYVLSIVFAPSGIGPASHLRSALLLLLGFAGCTLSFAYFYWNMEGIVGICSTSQAVYFSIVTASTTGYGDIHATTAASQTVTSLQIATSAVFLVSFFPVFFARTIRGVPTNQRR